MLGFTGSETEWATNREELASPLKQALIKQSENLARQGLMPSGKDAVTAGRCTALDNLHLATSHTLQNYLLVSAQTTRSGEASARVYVGNIIFRLEHCMRWLDELVENTGNLMLAQAVFDSLKQFIFQDDGKYFYNTLGIDHELTPDMATIWSKCTVLLGQNSRVTTPYPITQSRIAQKLV